MELSQADVLSRGRLVSSGGPGYHPDYWRLVGVPTDALLQRSTEAMDLVLRAWTADDAWSYEGESCSFERVHLLPRSHQRPRPPVSVGGGVEADVEQVAPWGDAWIAAPIPFEGEGSDRKVAVSRDAGAARGRPDPQVVLLRQLIFATRRVKADGRCEHRSLPRLRYCFRHGLLTNRPESQREAGLTADNAGRHLVVGTPAECADRMGHLVRNVVDRLVLKSTSQSATPVQHKRREFSLLDDEVRPRLRRSAESDALSQP